MKKAVSILLSMGMLMSIAPSVAFADGTTTKAFTYTETFDSVEDGQLPDGWTLYSNKDITKTSASVSNGALDLTNTNWYGDEWLLIDNITDVERNGLTMECDITYVQNTSTGGFENSKVGLAYAASVEDGTVTGDYVTLFTDITDPACQQIYMGGTKNDGSAWSKTLSDTNIADAININGDRPMHLRISFNNNTQGAVIYIDDTQIQWDRGSIYSDKYLTSGKIGLYIRNANVKIDNFKVTGTGTIPDTKTYKAEFKTPGAIYDSIEAAKADVVVSECDCFGNFEADVTGESLIEASDDGNGNITVNVSYGDFSETLYGTLSAFENRTFVYEEDFDNIDSGLPDGWTLYSKDTSKTTATVSGGVLNLTNTNWYGDEWFLFGLEDVARNGLTMECDITYVQNTSTGQLGNSRVGFAYMAEAESDGSVTGSWAAIRTDLDGSSLQEPDAQRGYISDGENKWLNPITFQATSEMTEGGTAVTALNKNNGQPMHFKIEFDGETQFPAIYLDGIEIYYEQPECDDMVTTGKVGLYLSNANVKIDNVKVTGTKRSAVVDDNYITVDPEVSYDSSGKELSITVDARATAENAAVIAAVYGADDVLISAEILNLDLSESKDHHGTLTLEGVDSEPGPGKVKVYLWDMDDLSPLAIPAVI